jgi:hypothetical protein
MTSWTIPILLQSNWKESGWLNQPGKFSFEVMGNCNINLRRILLMSGDQQFFEETIADTPAPVLRCNVKGGQFKRARRLRCDYGDGARHAGLIVLDHCALSVPQQRVRQPSLEPPVTARVELRQNVQELDDRRPIRWLKRADPDSEIPGF